MTGSNIPAWFLYSFQLEIIGDSREIKAVLDSF
ncbi:hypothetical protein SAMN05444396_11513 [Flavobacterium segetis]|uniref:Uncharacterized protein n=1 Tax=Flavobacterium segetis TaxID=271157 RepID=A0A1M5K1B5_9FLAO|nr:hypothetical protein SAMN05444396_11513 [Flavobacterium segetis]